MRFVVEIGAHVLCAGYLFRSLPISSLHRHQLDIYNGETRQRLNQKVRTFITDLHTQGLIRKPLTNSTIIPYIHLALYREEEEVPGILMLAENIFMI